MKHKLLIFIALFLSLKVYSQIDENYLEKESIMAKEDSSQLIRQNDSDKWLAEYIKETHAKLLQGNIEKDYRASVCDNLDFEEGNFTGWICQTGVNNGYPAGSWTGSLPVANRHTIETGGTDPYGGFPKVAPGGGTYSVRLGNDGVGRQAERIIFSFIVGPTDTNFIYKYAVVFEDPNHPVDEQPYFQLQILNSQNQVITCGQQHYTAASNIPGFIYAGNDVWYKPWTTVGIKLAAYVGQPVTVIVTNADCSRSGHFGYSYVDFICPQNMVAQTVNFCENDNSAILQVPNISPGATYLWSTGETTPTITINPQNFNDSTIQCYVTPPDVPTGCGFWYTFPINVNPLPIINVTSNPSTICYGESSLLSVNGANTYAWSHSLGSGITKTVTPTTSTTYSVTGTDINNCSNTATITVTVNPIPDISITADQTLCHNTQTTPINFTSSVTNTVFNWTNDNTTIGLAASGSGNISSFTATNTGSSPQTATIIATPSFTNNGVTCTGSSDTFLITVNPIPDIASVSDQSLCANLLTTPINFVSTVNNTLFSWINDNPSIGLPSSGSGNIPSFTVINESLELQTATIIVTPSFTNNGVTCTGVSETFLINVYPLTIAGFSVLPNHTSEDDGLVNIIDYSIGATSWYYDFGVEDDVNDIFTEREPIYRYNYEGNYTIMQIVNNQYNCPDTAYNDVIVKPSIIFYIPNAFTPNEDDKNEFFMPYGFNVSPLEYEFRIYDRWGKQLFYTTDINQGWDGKYKGEYVKQDMYVYMVKVRLEDGPQVFRGSVYLLK